LVAATQALLQPAAEHSALVVLPVSLEAERQPVLLELVAPAEELLLLPVEQQVFPVQPERAGP
jgi:hypothetical protein